MKPYYDEGGVTHSVGVCEDPTAAAIREECDALRDLLLAKNAAYGNSALDPVRIFSTADTVEQLKVRLDDKLSRLARGRGVDTEDVEQDLLGYLILLRVARRNAEDEEFPTEAAVEAHLRDVAARRNES